MYGWVDGLIDKWMDVWMGGWMNGWIGWMGCEDDPVIAEQIRKHQRGKRWKEGRPLTNDSIEEVNKSEKLRINLSGS